MSIVRRSARNAARVVACALGVAGVFASTGPSIASAAPAPDAAPQPPRNVVVLIGDGLGPVATTAARLMRYGDEGQLAMDAMPSVARMRTWSLDAQTTDAAAAVSAMMTGVRVRNGVVAMDGNTRSLPFAPGRDPIRGVPQADYRCPASANGNASTTLLELAIAKHRATGIVTTARLTSGAAAATYAHVCHRDAEYEAARQAVPRGDGYNPRLGRGVDVMLGGGSAYWRPFDAAKRPRGRPDARELVGELQAQGYAVATDLASMNAAPLAPGSRVIGLFDFNDADGAGTSPMSYDRDRDPKREPSLAEMTTKAIDMLNASPNGFVLVVEGGRIADALHATDARRALVDAIAFDDAVRATLDRVDLAKTLVVVAGDHDTPLALIGGSRRGADVLGLHLNPQTGKPDVDANGATYTALVFGTGPNRPDHRATLDTPTVVHDRYRQESAIKLPAATNAGGDVLVRAAGAGSTDIRGTFDNTRLFTLIRQAADL